MVIKEFLFRTTKLARSVAHLGHLGKVASQRSFLNRERKRFLMKIGEKVVEMVRGGKIEAPDLKRLVLQLEKIEALLKSSDYGGDGGAPFHPEEKKKKPARRSRKKRKRL